MSNTENQSPIAHAPYTQTNADEVETLKAHIAILKAALKTAEADRDYYRQQLEVVIAEHGDLV